MPDSLHLTLPWDVLRSVNHRVNRVGDRVRLTRDYRSAKDAAEMLVLSQVRGERPRFTRPVEVRLRFHEPDRRRRDPSNYLKMVEDVLTGPVYDDDKRIHRLTWERAGVDRADPKVEIAVYDFEAREGTG